ncbi:MAG: Rep family protein [Lactococcus lactis]
MSSEIAKARNFTFIIYPESIPEDWQDCLIKLDVPMAISPLHDMDEKKDKSKWENTDIIRNGKHYKKAHYHVIYIARNPVTVESVRKKIKRVLGNKSLSHIEIVDSVSHVYKYLTHESADAIKKKKHKYDFKDIVLLNDFDIDRYVTMDESQKKELFNALTVVIYENKLENYFDLVEFVLNKGGEIGISNLGVLNDVISARTGLLRLALDGAYQRRKRSEPKKYDEQTGELL